MTYYNKTDIDFMHYLESMVNLDALERLTSDLDKELKDSQIVMNEIKGMIDALPSQTENRTYKPGENEFRNEDLSNFLSAGTTKLLMQDMEANIDLDVDDIIATMKSYTEDLKKSLISTEEPKEAKVFNKMQKLDLEPYATSLEHLCKRLSTLKLNKEEDNRNSELEAKLSILCDDVLILTKMVEATKSLSDVNQKISIPKTSNNEDVFEFENLISKLLAGINEVSYLLQNKI